jgi:hypothetical protein
MELDSNSTWSKGKCANASFEHGDLLQMLGNEAGNRKDELQ